MKETKKEAFRYQRQSDSLDAKAPINFHHHANSSSVPPTHHQQPKSNTERVDHKPRIATQNIVDIRKKRKATDPTSPVPNQTQQFFSNRQQNAFQKDNNANEDLLFPVLNNKYSVQSSPNHLQPFHKQTTSNHYTNHLMQSTAN